ncbi:right-handed parallel beta-helix repeat-containing protein [Streptomyces sp. ACA25]|uniref:right-handed parallel beta-helix repeat-containing protein n=1 Tax=Streptomyces sp. ACA25 TaxID=3022596 RepID=UPI0023074CFB|nr:right-handed parallel beta-helix repeat-containing protein [Streptomyces sp. ACA25]MDB1086538.1 right-handed parallel beta-helix repeat-containing protein [Streptomyces sp. ACA25]
MELSPSAVVALLAAVLMTTTVTGCGALSPEPNEARPGPPGHQATIAVPEDAATLQQAVDAAVPGDLVLIAEGVYREDVVVRTPRIVLRGTDRNSVVIDGQSQRRAGVTVTADEVTVENLTVRGHTAAGVRFTGTPGRPLLGYRASYLTVHDNARHGVRATHTRRGVIEHSYASGHSHAGIHLEHCAPCHTVVRDNLTERNARGIALGHASHGLTVRENHGSGNRLGIADLSGGRAPGVVIRDNILPDGPAPGPVPSAPPRQPPLPAVPAAGPPSTAARLP